MRVAIGAKSDVGRVREANEDSYLVAEPLFVVADGMGGHLAGDVASSTAVKVINDESSDASSSDPSSLTRIVSDANARIWEMAQSDPQLRGMGTTCTLMLVDEDRVHIAHVGDSRAYRFRGGDLQQITQDHTLVGRMVAEGKLQPEEAQHHPQRSIITRALGVDEDVQVDLETVDVSEGDRVLLCSDGLSSMVEEDLIRRVLDEESNPQEAADRLVDVANENGGEDNVTVVVIDFTDQSSPRAMIPAKEDGRSAEPARVDTKPGARSEPAPTPAEDEGRSRPWGRRLLVAVVIIALLAGGAYAAARYALSNSWYVGLDGSNAITIYRGIPDDIAGLELREVEGKSSTELGDLPDFKRDDVRSGIKADSFEDAQGIVQNLEEIAQDFQERNRQRDNNNKKSN